MKLPKLLCQTIVDNEVVIKNSKGNIIKRLGAAVYNPEDKGECIGYRDKSGKVHKFPKTIPEFEDDF